MNPTVKKNIPLQILRDLKTKPLPQLHEFQLHLLLISHHYLLLCLDSLPLPSLHLQQSQKLSYISVTILWTSVTSAGQGLLLPLDSCCSVSLVSKVHADFIASKRSNLKYCPLEEPISVAAADPKSNLKAAATMEIPNTWETKTELYLPY